jgi:hypothetical protein
MSQPPRPPVALGDSLATLTDMLDAMGGTVDRDRRRAAARVSELVRSADEDLPRFAERHMPGREVDVEVLKDARELVVDVAQLIALIGEDPIAATKLRELRASLSRDVETREGDAMDDAPAKPPSAVPAVLAAPSAMPAPPAASALPSFMQAPLAGPSPTWPSADEPARITPAPVTQPTPPSVSVPKHEVPVRKEIADLGGTQKLRALPPGTVAPPVLPFASPAGPTTAPDPASRPEAPTTALPFVPPPQRRG